ncbi:unnamed protein product [Cunninghamella echinulata]
MIYEEIRKNSNNEQEILATIEDTPSSKGLTNMNSTKDIHLTSACIIYEKKTVVGFILIPFAIAGVLIRIALQRLEAYHGAPVFPLVYAQWVGCFIMGIATTQKANIMVIYHPLQLGLSTGLCGSITTFSSWQLSIFSSFANIDNYDHTRGKNILSALSQLLITLAMSINGYQFGGHIGQWLNTNSWWLALINKILNWNSDNKQVKDNSQQQIPKLDIIPCGFSIDKLVLYYDGIFPFLTANSPVFPLVLL